MKLRISNFQNDINLFDGIVSIVEIHNVKYFSKFIQNLNDAINGLESNEIILLSDDNKRLKLEREALLLIDLYNIDFNSKKIISKIYEFVSNNIKNSQDEKILNHLNVLRHYIDLELTDLPFEFQMKEVLNVEEILKLFSVKIDCMNYQTVFEKLQLLIELMANLKLASILIIPNLKQFLTEEELVEIYKYSMYNEMRLVLIERKCDQKLQYEQIMCIDENFDDYIY